MSAQLDRETIRAMTDADLVTVEQLALRCPADATPGHWDLAASWVPRLVSAVRSERDDTDALAGALREAVERCEACHRLPYTVDGRPCRCARCTDALALLGRLGYGTKPG